MRPTNNLWRLDWTCCQVRRSSCLFTLQPRSRRRLTCKSGGLDGPARIGRVTFSMSGRSIHCGGRTFQSLDGSEFKATHFDVESGDHFWMSGPRKDGADGLYGGSKSVEIDADVEREYWRDIHGHNRQVCPRSQ